jgi:hypothetical protein
VPTDTCVGTLSGEVPLGSLGRESLADEAPIASLMTDDSKRLVAASRSAGRQVLIED